MSQPRNTSHDAQSPQDARLCVSYHSEMSRRQAMKALFALAGAAVLFGRPRPASAASATKETTDALAAAQQRFDEAQAQMDELADEFQKLSIAQDKVIGQIEDVQGDIDETQKELESQQRKLEKKQKVLADRVASSYKKGGDNPLDILLSSASFDELISNGYYISKVNASDERAIDDVQKIQDQLRETKGALELQKQDLEGLKAEQTEQLEQMKAKKDEVQALIDSLDKDVKDLINKRDAEILAAAAAEEAARHEAAKRPSTSIPGNGQGSANAGDLQQLVVTWCHKTPSPGLGLCAWWVSDVFERAGICNVSGNADDMYNAWCTSSNKANLQVGMIIAVSSHSHTSAGRIYGHVGIYVGDNTVMDNIGYIRSINVDSWISYYGDTVTPRWGWACGIDLAG